MTERNVVLEVDRANHGSTRLVEADLPALGDGEVRLRVDRFALTANNITYAGVGDMLGYWEFFPAADGWGRVPAMGWADVIESTHPDVEVGGRYYGWYPMARFLDMTVGVTGDGIRDDGDHRLAHAPVYRSLVEASRDPWYEASADAEDRHALLRGLFVTGFLAEWFFADDDYFGASQVIVLSASSKTAVGFAQRAHERGAVGVVGVTGAHHVEFVRSLGWYDTVVAYDDLSSLDRDAPVVSIDMAGNQQVLARLHALFDDRLRYSMTIGRSHHDAPPAEVTGGPSPQLFFAPTEVARRQAAWGSDAYGGRVGDALSAFVGASHGWLTVERAVGPAAAEAAYAAVYAGDVPPNVGNVVSLHD